MSLLREVLKSPYPADVLNEAFLGRASTRDRFVAAWRNMNRPRIEMGLCGIRAFRSTAEWYGGIWISSALYLRAIINGDEFDLGVASFRLVTTAGVQFIVDDFQGTATNANFRFHGIGTGAVAEAIGDTALGTEWAGADYTGGTRANGSQGEGAAANVYRTVGTNTKASAGTSNVTEHGIFTQAALAGGTLLDRSVFTAVPLNQNDGLQSTYDFTVNAGG